MAMEETLALEKAVEVAMSLTKREETLTIVTADHSHAVTDHYVHKSISNQSMYNMYIDGFEIIGNLKMIRFIR